MRFALLRLARALLVEQEVREGALRHEVLEPTVFGALLEGRLPVLVVGRLRRFLHVEAQILGPEGLPGPAPPLRYALVERRAGRWSGSRSRLIRVGAPRLLLLLVRLCSFLLLLLLCRLLWFL